MSCNNTNIEEKKEAKRGTIVLAAWCAALLAALGLLLANFSRLVWLAVNLLERYHITAADLVPCVALLAIVLAALLAYVRQA